MANTPERHPLDFDAVRMGDSWGPERLEWMVEAKRDSVAYQLGVLRLKDRIERECRDRGKLFTLAVVRGVLRVLTDEEAARYTQRRVRAGFRTARRSLHKQLAVDPTELTDAHRREHERNLLVNGRMIQAALTERRRLTARKPHRPTVPPLFAPPPAGGSSDE